MALRTAPHPYAHPDVAPALVVIPGRRGVAETLTIRATELADLVDEITARKAEAVALVVGLLPLVAFVTNAAREVGPREYQAALAIAARLRRYRAQNEAPEPDAGAVAA